MTAAMPWCSADSTVAALSANGKAPASARPGQAPEPEAYAVVRDVFEMRIPTVSGALLQGMEGARRR